MQHKFIVTFKFFFWLFVSTFYLNAVLVFVTWVKYLNTSSTAHRWTWCCTERLHSLRVFGPPPPSLPLTRLGHPAAAGCSGPTRSARTVNTFRRNRSRQKTTVNTQHVSMCSMRAHFYLDFTRTIAAPLFFRGNFRQQTCPPGRESTSAPGGRHQGQRVYSTSDTGQQEFVAVCSSAHPDCLFETETNTPTVHIFPRNGLDVMWQFLDFKMAHGNSILATH